ncbi:hypothetical protein SAMN05444481_11368 [Flavobacterium frigidimaris]|nr:hypothetical protein SAMN05444481_11368 [Flavobacterium frigidimaris]
MENKNNRLVILLIIFSILALYQVFLFSYSTYPLIKSLVMILNSLVILFYSKAITNNLQEK